MTAVIALVVARAENGVIGRDGAVPWRIPADMQHFRRVTMGKPCIMGRKTWESLPKKPLPGRTNIVITRDRAFQAAGAVVVHSLEDALSRAQAAGPEEIAVIGGADIYGLTLPYAGRVYLTEVHADIEGDTVMPPLDPADWKETARERHERDAADHPFSFVTLERR
jgi:dihydrofolate reductase